MAHLTKSMVPILRSLTSSQTDKQPMAKLWIKMEEEILHKLDKKQKKKQKNRLQKAREITYQYTPRLKPTSEITPTELTHTLKSFCDFELQCVENLKQGLQNAPLCGGGSIKKELKQCKKLQSSFLSLWSTSRVVAENKSPGGLYPALPGEKQDMGSCPPYAPLPSVKPTAPPRVMAPTIEFRGTADFEITSQPESLTTNQISEVSLSPGATPHFQTVDKWSLSDSKLSAEDVKMLHELEENQKARSKFWEEQDALTSRLRTLALDIDEQKRKMKNNL